MRVITLRDDHEKDARDAYEELRSEAGRPPVGLSLEADDAAEERAEEQLEDDFVRADHE